MGNDSRIMQLALAIAQKTSQLDAYFTANELPTPSLDVPAVESLQLPKDDDSLYNARVDTIDACEDLAAPLKGPRELLAVKTANTSLRAILHFKLEKAFAVGEKSSFEALAQTSGLALRDVRKIIRHGIHNNYLFQKTTPGIIMQSPLTRALAGDEILRETVELFVEELVPASFKLTEALEKWPGSEENNKAAFTLANDGKSSMYDIFDANPLRGKRFAKAISHMSTTVDYDLELFLTSFQFPEKDTLVDVGGSQSMVSFAIGRRFPYISCVVQDLPAVVEQGEAQLPDDLKGIVTFMAYNFFIPQPLVADIYYLRSTLHNWSDKNCTLILRNLIPALKNGAIIVVNELVAPGDLGTLSKLEARRIVNMDISMLQLLNARQRELREWRDLFDMLIQDSAFGEHTSHLEDVCESLSSCGKINPDYTTKYLMQSNCFLVY